MPDKPNVEQVPDDKVDVLPPQTSGVITLAIDIKEGKTDMDLGGFSPFQAAVYLKLAADYLSDQVTKQQPHTG